ncbi:MAG: hypothetical protein ACRD1A_01455 [Terriglobales bacterium]
MDERQQPSSGGAGAERRESQSADAWERESYDDVVEASFPASDPPPGVIKLGPRPRRKAA